MKSFIFALFAMLFSGSAFAQAPASFVPITLDGPKVQELINEVPMTTATRGEVVKLLNRWELETQAAQHSVSEQKKPADTATPTAPDDKK